MSTRVAKPAVEEEEVDPPEDLGDDEDDDEDDDDDEEDDEDEDEGEMTAERVAQDVAVAIRDAMENQASAIAEKRRILLDLDDDTRWIITVKPRD